VRKICIVSEECNGVARGGGIGACVRGLCELWSAAGIEVDLLITDFGADRGRLAGQNLSFVNRLFFLHEIVADDAKIFAPVDAPSKAYCVYRFLRSRDYAEVHFNDWLGSGFYTAMARRQGLFDATVVTHVHGSSEWVRAYNLNPPELENLETEAIERSQIENSDLVISPSQYLLGWYAERGVKLPRAIQRHWVLPQWLDPASPVAEAPLATRAVAPGSVNQIIYFGRHERRKGFELFVDAIARLPDDVQPDITFVGRFDRIAREFTGSLALRKLRDHGGRLRFHHDLDQVAATTLLRRSPGALCVMPSLIENSPCVIGECLTFGIPFLTTDVGGTAELIDPASRAHCLVKPAAADLAAAITRVARDGMPPIVSTLSPRSIFATWKEPTSSRAVAEPLPGREPLVTVCFTHYERPRLLRRAYEAILAQTYANIEIVIVDDGSRSEGAHAYLDEIEASAQRFPVTIARAENNYLGAARNAAARHARGEYLLFHDDDNFAEPNEVATFVKAALNFDADVLTAQCHVFHDGEYDQDGPVRRIEFYPIGIGGVFSFFRNRFGDANALVRRTTFEAIGGFTEERGVGWEDWEFFLKAHLKNYRMGIVPEPLFNYRASETGMLGTGNPLLNFERLYKAIDVIRPAVGSELLRYTNRVHFANETLNRTLFILSREKGSELHQALTEVDPNSAEAINLLSDLAFELGRFGDALELGAKDYFQRDKIVDMMKALPSLDPSGRESRELMVVPPEAGHDGVLLEGWMIDGRGDPFDPAKVMVNGQWFSVVGISRFDRPDVAAALHLASGKNAGFHLYAVPVSGARNPVARAWRGLTLAVRAKRGRMAKAPSFVFTGLSVKLPNARGQRGHVDRASWQRRVRLDLPTDRHDTPRLEIETAVAAQTAILWSDGAIDAGIRTSSRRGIFRHAALGTAGQGEVCAIVPANIRAHIVLV
jgi:glycosyltransferase involved in cell wall biosynthesis